jgi:uncharacterized protein with von Willebrand factor type A (vWA) domain
MLIDFFLELRRSGVSVSTHEWLALMQALDKGLHESSLDGFYRFYERYQRITGSSYYQIAAPECRKHA